MTTPLSMIMTTIFPLVMLCIFILPLVLIFQSGKKARALQASLVDEQRQLHAQKAVQCAYATAFLAITLFLLCPFSPLYQPDKGGHNGSYLNIYDGMLLFSIRLFAFMFLFMSAVAGIKHARLATQGGYRHVLHQRLFAIGGYLSFVLAGLSWLLNNMSGLGWGRPLRVAGKIIKPDLTPGTDWAQGEQPDATHLNAATKRALEALWLHDAKKEYASVPAFSRLGWQMAALAAPPELLRDIHIAAIQEIDHARKCFALAAGFGEHPWTVLPLPAMLQDNGKLNDPLLSIAVESLSDGCLLEGFNADIAEQSALICRDPASLKMIRQIAREERAHAELSWRILVFCLQADSARVGPALRGEMTKLAGMARPTAASSQNMALMAEADSNELKAFGRLPDSEFESIWWARVRDTEQRLLGVLGEVAVVVPRVDRLAA